MERLGAKNVMDSLHQPDSSKTTVKSIFSSKTFWGAVLTAVAGIAPIVGEAVEEGKLSVDQTVNIVVILATTGTAVIGRVQANESLVYTPNGLPGPNKEDLEQA
jgi:formaldehyde-activating enzyme involved in methanogenesis